MKASSAGRGRCASISSCGPRYFSSRRATLSRVTRRRSTGLPRKLSCVPAGVADRDAQRRRAVEADRFAGWTRRDDQRAGRCASVTSTHDAAVRAQLDARRRGAGGAGARRAGDGVGSPAPAATGAGGGRQRCGRRRQRRRRTGAGVPRAGAAPAPAARRGAGIALRAGRGARRPRRRASRHAEPCRRQEVDDRPRRPAAAPSRQNTGPQRSRRRRAGPSAPGRSRNGVLRPSPTCSSAVPPARRQQAQHRRRIDLQRAADGLRQRAREGRVGQLVEAVGLEQLELLRRAP